MSIVAYSGYATVGGLVGQHALGLVVGEDDLMHRVAAVLEGNVVAVYVRRKKDFCRALGVMYMGNIHDRTSTYRGSTQSLGWRKGRRSKDKSATETNYNKAKTLTSRGGPSGSPMLMTVHSCLERDEPTKTRVSHGDKSTVNA
jgi:hypothetical protein